MAPSNIWALLGALQQDSSGRIHFRQASVGFDKTDRHPLGSEVLLDDVFRLCKALFNVSENKVGGIGDIAALEFIDQGCVRLQGILGGLVPYGFPGKSLPVITAMTPRSASARLVSMLAMLAWALELRKILPCSIPGAIRSPAYLALPVTFTLPSVLSTDFPTTEYSPISVHILSKIGIFIRLHCGGLSNLEIPGTFIFSYPPPWASILIVRIS
jgi:hypothetical protein